MFNDLSSKQELAGWAQDFCHDQFRLSDPPQLHRVLAGEALVQSVQRARKAFGQALEPRRLVEQMFAETGLHLEDLAIDRIIFRVQPPIVCEDASDLSVHLAPLALPRDTLPTNLYATIKWEGPVLSV